MTLGNVMAASGVVMHAHLTLIGWVSSAIFGGFYYLSEASAASMLAFAAVVLPVVRGRR